MGFVLCGNDLQMALVRVSLFHKGKIEVFFSQTHTCVSAESFIPSSYLSSFRVRCQARAMQAYLLRCHIDNNDRLRENICTT